MGYDIKASVADGTAWMEREGLSGKKLCQDDYLNNFTDAARLYITDSSGAAAMTINVSLDVKRIHFCVYSSLSCGWDYCWSHEMAHALDNDIFLAGSRHASTEDYTDGLLTQQFGTTTYTMNLTNDFAASSDCRPTSRASASLAQRSWMTTTPRCTTRWICWITRHCSILELDKDEQNAVAPQARYDGRTGNSPLDVGATATILSPRNTILEGFDGTAETAPLNLSAFNDGSKKFETVEEVYDNQLFLYPDLKGTASSRRWRTCATACTS